MRRRDANRQIFGSWPTWKVVVFALYTLVWLVATIGFTIPLGWACLGYLLGASLIWPDPNDPHPLYGAPNPGTLPYSFGSFFATLGGGNRSHFYSPTVLFGFGPPEDDVIKELQASIWSPPTRLAAYFSAGFGFCLSFIDRLIYPSIPSLHGMDIPIIITQTLSAVGFFALMQMVVTLRRYQIGETLSGVDHVPAVMMSHVGDKNTVFVPAITRSLIKAGIMFAVCTVIIVALSITVGMPVLMPLVVAFVGSISGGLYLLFRELTETYREDFQYQIEQRDKWNNIFAYKKDKAPFPERTEPLPPQPTEDDPHPEPHVWSATFSYPTNATFADFENEAPKLSPSLAEAEMLIVNPIPRKTPNGDTIFGSVSDIGFRVMWADELVTLNTLLTQPDITPEHKEIAVRYSITDPLSRVRGLGRAMVHSHSFMTDKNSPVQIMKVVLLPPEGTTVSTYMGKIPEISDALSAQWVRFSSSIQKDGRSTVDMFIGNGRPNDPRIVYPKGLGASRNAATLNQVEWEYVFSTNKVASASGAPSLIMSRPVTEVSQELIFDLPAGVSFSSVQRAQEALKTTSGNSYIEVHEGIPSKKNFTSRENRELKRFFRTNHSVSQFSAVVSPEHPLDRKFLFSAYKDQLVTGREPGVAKMSWSPGPKANGELSWHSFEKDMAHLLIAGSSGSGKSVLIYSMLCQLMANNSPSDLQFQIIDPKIGFQEFQFVDNVTRYVDQWTPDGNFYQNVRDMLSDLNDEMVRRNELFRFAKSQYPIDKLGVARAEAIRQGPLPDGSANPLMQPFIIAVVDECAMLFTDSPDQETKEIQREILYFSAKLARESRSAGIHVVFATQYPTNASMPSLIRQQCGRIGLATSDKVASQVIIDQPGLEELWIKGSGKIQEDKNFYDFRGFLLEDDSSDEHSMADILQSLPSRDPNPQYDGERYASQATDKEDQQRVDVPQADDSLYDKWSRSRLGITAQALTEGDRRASFLESLDTVTKNIPDDVFSSFRSAEDFKEYLKEQGSRRKRR